MNWIMHNKLIFIVATLLVAGGIWYGLSQGGAPDPLLTTTAPDGSAARASDQEIIGTLLALRAVTLSGTIFSDPAFATLQDFGTTIVPEPVGRQNPFAPLGAPQVSSSQPLSPTTEAR